MEHHIVHLTSVHPRYDTRIFLKMCSSLASQNYHVSLVVADGMDSEVKNGVNIVDVGARTGGRLSRMTKTVSRVFNKAKELDADIYHLHDPELIPIGLKLKKSGKKVIFDAHEDLPKQLLSKPYLNKQLLFILSKAFSVFEKWSCKQLDAVISATPAITDKFRTINTNAVTINNFPILGELSTAKNKYVERNKVIFVGGMSKIRGITELVGAANIITNKLILVGNVSCSSYLNQLSDMPGWYNVEAVGQKDREEVAELLSQSFAGIVTYLPLPNHVDAQPNKMFEYMSAGVPVIASHYPLWKEIVEGSKCGICVDPEDPVAIANAIEKLASNPELVEVMSKNGQDAVVSKYNWGAEEKNLFNLYQGILS
ncbi:MAG: glycosyltransferase family 4 protein [Psychromonas sp.]|nr:glycosyltransferase family 4 protein [Alteromonadales bacterium]MCP5077440.1 glycosyltransferase family 4 protein [Psychromonas sp.]